MNPNPYMEFSLTETGGGCQALMANHFGVTYMITDSGDPSAPRDGQPVDLGVYFDDAGYLDGNYAYFGTFVNLGYAKTMSAMIAAKLATATENERATWSIVAADPGLHADDIFDQGGSQEAADALVEQGFIERHANGTYSPVISSPADYRGNDYGIDEAPQAAADARITDDYKRLRAFERIEPALVAIYREFERAIGRTLGSADEHLDDESLTADQRKWLLAYVQLWEATAEGL